MVEARLVNKNRENIGCNARIANQTFENMVYELVLEIHTNPEPASLRERLFAVHGLSERTTVQTSSLLLRLFFFYLLANPIQPDPYR